MNNSWHSDTIARFKSLTSESLVYIRDDSLAAAKAGETIGNPKTGQYWDEYHYSCMELTKRSKQAETVNQNLRVV